MSVKRTLGAPHLNTIFNVNAMQSDLYQVFTFRQHQSTMVCLNTLTKKKIETLLINLQSSRVCQSVQTNYDERRWDPRNFNFMYQILLL